MRLQLMLLFPVIACWVLTWFLCVRLPDRVRFPAVAVLGLFVAGFLTVLYLLANHFTGEGITEAVVFHALYGPDGLGVWQFPELLFGVTGSVALLALGSYGLFRYLSRTRDPSRHARPSSRTRTVASASVYGLLLFSITAHPAVHDTLLVLEKHNYKVTPDSEQFAQNLRPIRISPTTKRPKNIIYLYVESLERTYFDEQRFPGLIRELRALERQSLSFTGVRQTLLTDWTIAGMTASQCGIPLSTFRRPNEVAAHERFVPGATCIGDILSEHGYALSYRGGADVNFAGKGRFYTEHGFRDVRGRFELLKDLPADEPVSRWGLYDDRLYELLFHRYAELSRHGRPFGLFALTLDTHPPHGHETPACKNIRYGDGSNRMLNAVACADHLAGKFIRKVLASPAARDTLLVVGSDHLAMQSGALELLDQNGPEARRNLLMIFNSGRPPAQIAKPGSTLDIGPTVLSLLGLKTDALALGRNLLGEEPTLVETMGTTTLNERIERWRLSLYAMGRQD